MPSYVGYVTGRKILLGGVKVHGSSRFERESDARDWAGTVAEINREAGRAVESVDVVESDLPPQITAAQMA